MKIADLGQLGYLPLQCFDPRYALEVRPALFATRIERRWSDSLGRYVQEASSSGDVLCSFLWKTNGAGSSALTPGGVTTTTGPGGGAGGLAGRKIPGWAFGWPVVVDSDAPDAPQGDDDQNAYDVPKTVSQPSNWGGGFGGIPQTTSGPHSTSAQKTASVLPVYDATWKPDTRFTSKQIVVPPGTPPLPKGTVGLAFAGTRELSQEELLFPLSNSTALIAPHWDGDFWRATRVHDLTSDNKPDQQLKAKIHQLLRVYEIPKHCGARTNATVGFLGRPGNHSLALQMGTARGGLPGNLLLADDRKIGLTDVRVQDFGVCSDRLSGPFTVGTCGKHLYDADDPANTKYERFRPLHLSTEAYWEAYHFGCGPVNFERAPWPKCGDNGTPVLVHLAYDATAPHGFSCGERLGVWKLWTTQPTYKPGTGRQSVPGEEESWKTYPGLANDPNVTLPGDGGDPEVISTPAMDPDPPTSPYNDPEKTDTNPPEPGITDPATEGFHSAQGTLADPGPNASHNVRDIGIEGLTTPETDPWDGPTPTSTTTEKPTIGGQTTGQPGSGAGATPTGRPFGMGFLETIASYVQPSVSTYTESLTPPPFGWDQSKTARARAGVALDYLAFAQEVGVSALVFRAQPVAPGVPTFVNSPTFGPGDTSWIDGASAAVGRFEPFVKTLGGYPSFTGGVATGGRYGPEGSGGLVYLPPGIGLEQIYDGKAPSSSCDSSFICYSGANAGCTIGIGTPYFPTGTLSDGFEISLSPDGMVLTFDRKDSTAGYDASVPLVIDANAGTVTGFGVTFGSGGSGAFTTGTLAGRPATPASVGDGYVITNKIDNNGTSGNTDASEAISVGILDALAWAKLAIINGFPQTISSNWTFSGASLVSGSLAKTGAGTIDANKLVGVTVSTGPTSGRALVYNGTNFVTTGLGVTGGGTGLTSLAGTHSLLYVSAANTLTESGAPADTKGGMAFQTNPAAAIPTWSRDLLGGDQTGSDQNGVDRTIAGMRSTGTGVGGIIFFKTSPAGGAGSSNNALVTAAFVDGSSNVVLHGTGSALATNATNGFTYLPFCAGSPSGVPANLAGGYAGAVPVTVDTTNGRFYGYYGGTWNNLSATGSGASLATTLGIGNTTGANDIVLTSGQALAGEDSGGGTDGGAAWVRGGFGNGTNKASGGSFLDAGSSTGTGESALFFQLAKADTSSGSGSNSSAMVAEIRGTALSKLSSVGNFFGVYGTFSDGGSTFTTTVRHLFLSPTIDYTAATKTGKYEVLVVDPTISSEPTGANLLAAFRKGGADKCLIDTAGKVTGVSFAQSSGPTWTSGSGTPEGAVTAPVGSLFSRTDGGAGTSLYVKESGSGNTGWVGK